MIEELKKFQALAQERGAHAKLVFYPDGSWAVVAYMLDELEDYDMAVGLADEPVSFEKYDHDMFIQQIPIYWP